MKKKKKSSGVFPRPKRVSNLPACPICDTMPELAIVKVLSEKSFEIGGLFNDEDTRFRVVCDKCGFTSGYFRKKEDAVDTWMVYASDCEERKSA